MISRGPGFLLPSYESSTLPLSPVMQFARPATESETEKERKLVNGRGKGGGVGEEPNHITARKHGPL
jgi:hypothetical protein